MFTLVLTNQISFTMTLRFFCTRPTVKFSLTVLETENGCNKSDTLNSGAGSIQDYSRIVIISQCWRGADLGGAF